MKNSNHNEQMKKWRDKNKGYFAKYYQRTRNKNSRIRGKEYCFRVIVKGKNRKPVYGLSVPSYLVKKHNLLGKIFRIDTMFNGKFILYTKINKKNEK